jgi:hypothetical protein
MSGPPPPRRGRCREGRFISAGAVRGLLLRCKKGYWQALTGAVLLDLPFGLLVFGLIKHTLNDVFIGTSSENKKSQDNLPSVAYF